MQEIERYGLITLLLLVVSTVAVVMWDGSDEVGASPQGQTTTDLGRPNVNSPNGWQVRNQQDVRGGGEARERRESQRLTDGAPVNGQQARPSARQLPSSTRQDVVAQDRRERGGARLGNSELGRQGQGTTLSMQQPSGAAGALANLISTGEASQRPIPGRDVFGGESREGAPASPLGSGIVDEPVAPQAASSQSPDDGNGPLIVELPENETISHLAQRYLGGASKWQLILDANPNLNPNNIAAGAEILIPDIGYTRSDRPTGGGGQQASSTAAVATALSATRPYVVARGESAWRIAQRELGSGARWTELVGLNPALDLNALDAGDTLLLPVGVAAAAEAQGRSGVR